MFEDGVCQQINNLTGGWQTLGANDWIYYPQQYGMSFFPVLTARFKY
jgi:hypothetical protein